MSYIILIIVIVFIIRSLFQSKHNKDFNKNPFNVFNESNNQIQDADFEELD